MTALLYPAARALNDLPIQLIRPLAILDLEHPEVGIARDLAGDVGVGLGFGHRIRPGAAAPRRFAVERARLGVDGDAGLEAVELHQHRARIGIAATNDRRRNESPIAEPHLPPPPPS